MRVVKRDGTSEIVLFDKISARVRRLASGAGGKLNAVDVTRITTMVVSGMFDGITTSQIDDLAADACVSLLTEHPEYGILAARIVVSNMHKNTSDSILETYELMSSILSDEFLDVVRTHSVELQTMMDYRRDYDFDYFAIKTLESIYCARVGGMVVERPQHVYMRVSIAIHGDDLKRVKETYSLLSRKKFTHASPTLFNAGLRVQQMSSCYLNGVEDSLDSITDMWKEISNISKLGGGIGTHVHAVRSKGAPITSTNGVSDGLIPMLRVMNSIVSYINQSGRRKGSMAIYLSPHHPDIMDFLELRRPGGEENMRCRDLFLAMWMPDLFMHRVEADGEWSLFDPFETPGLDDVCGPEYDALYEQYEREGKAKATVRAREIWTAILRSQIETGTPYMLYKDACNVKSNQQNLGTIKCSNLCVAPETKILTRRLGQSVEIIEERSIVDLVDQEVVVWNGREWSAVTVKKTSDDAEVVRVTVWCDTTQTARVLECTEYHKFHVRRCLFGSKIKRAGELKFGDRVVKWKDPVEGRWMRQRVVTVERFGRRTPTYCFSEPLRHAGVFGGILTGQCSEIVEYTSPQETSVCTLASISLPAFVKNGTYDFAELAKVVKVVARNLDKLIDINVYPVDKAKVSNFKHRPIGLGVQGLADTYVLMRHAFDSMEAAELNAKIFATMYHAALEASAELAAESGAYETYQGSPASRGLLQFDLWGVEGHPDVDWQGLKNKIRKHGLRNSLSIAVMPTASTAQVLGNNESIEPFTSLLFTRRTLAGEFVVINRHLVDELVSVGLWNQALKDSIIANNGSVQSLTVIPPHIRELYKTAWDISQRVIIDQSADRSPYVCQSQSLNLFVAEPTHEKLTSMHFYGWRRGLKTGQYYLRSKAASHAKKITLSHSESDNCLMCSS